MFKQKIASLNLLIPVLLCLLAACTKTTPFGADLLTDQTADYDYTDTVTVEFSIERDDSTITSDRTLIPYFLCGELDDDIFGRSRAEINALVQLGTFAPDFDSVKYKVDSLVLYLRYDASGVYGDTTQPQTIKVSRLTDPLVYDATYYAYQNLTAGQELGSVSFLPKPRTLDSLFSASTRAAYVSIPLNNNFANELFHLDSARLVSDTAFYNYLRGFKITTTSNTGIKPGAMLAFALNEPNYSRLRLYYSEKDTAVQKTFDFFFQGANKFVHYSQNYTGTVPGALIGQKAENLLYAQGMNGIRLKVTLPYINQLENIVVNEADLVLTAAANVPNDNPFLKPANQLVLLELQGDTSLVLTTDVVYSLGPSLNGGFSAFGGFPVDEKDNGTDVVRYRLALSDKLQQMVDEPTNDPKKKTLYVTVYPQSRSVMRSIFYGPKSATFPAKLALKYTRL